MGIAALLLVAVLSACGGEDESPESATTATNVAPSKASPATPDGISANDRASTGTQVPARSEQGEERAGQGAGGASSRDGEGIVSPQSAAFQQYSGTGKLNLAEFGSEGSSVDRSAAQAVVTDYLRALAGEQWTEACALLLPETRAEIGQFSGQASPGQDCSGVLPKVAEVFGSAAGNAPALATEGIASLRLKEGGRAGEGAGFALFRDSNGEDRWIAVKKANERWWIFSVVPQPFQ